MDMKNKCVKLISISLGLLERFKLKDNKFIIISNNCWGGDLYKYTKRKYNTPFIGLFLYPKCYLKICSNIERYLKIELVELSNISKYKDDKCNYPIGLLDDVEIHFLHYKTFSEAKEKWSRRCSRFFDDYSSSVLLYKFCDSDSDSDSDSDIIEFNNILEEKLFITFTRKKVDIKNNYEVNEKLNGIELFDRRFKFIRLHKLLIEANCENKERKH